MLFNFKRFTKMLAIQTMKAHTTAIAIIGLYGLQYWSIPGGLWGIEQLWGYDAATTRLRHEHNMYSHQSPTSAQRHYLGCPVLLVRRSVVCPPILCAGQWYPLRVH